MYIIMSDMHFGMAESSVNRPEVLEGMQEFFSEVKDVDAVVFSGDLLDLNLSTFTNSIEGMEDLVGFRAFIDGIVSSCGPWVEECRRVYVPGNHDYRVWDILSTQVACTDVLARGNRMGSVETPARSGCWPDGEAFIAGVFPRKVRRNVIVEYPEHVIECEGGRVLVTHGHYIDEHQTQFKRMDEYVKEEGSVDRAMRRMFIETAQYQAVAGAVSYTKN